MINFNGEIYEKHYLPRLWNTVWIYGESRIPEEMKIRSFYGKECCAKAASAVMIEALLS